MFLLERGWTRVLRIEQSLKNIGEIVNSGRNYWPVEEIEIAGEFYCILRYFVKYASFFATLLISEYDALSDDK